MLRVRSPAKVHLAPRPLAAALALASAGLLASCALGLVVGADNVTSNTFPTAAPGFKVERLRSTAPGEGPWTCLSVDGQGRLLLTSEEGPWLVVELTPRGQVQAAKVLAAPLRQVGGLCHADGAFYAGGSGPSGVGLYRFSLADGGERFEPKGLHLLNGPTVLVPRAIAAGLDAALYLAVEMDSGSLNAFASNQPYRVSGTGSLLRGLPDPDGGKGSGYLVRTDPEGKRWALWAGGIGIANSLAVNSDGELFGLEAATQADCGLPWFRPLRLAQIVSGAEYGWRPGSRRLPEWRPEVLPSVVELGLGLPGGIKSGGQSKFRPQYQKAMFVGDSLYGRILAVFLTPKGAHYTAEVEPFVQKCPIPVSALEIGPDGALLFLAGSNQPSSGLYRVSFSGQLPAEAASGERDAEDNQPAAARAQRRKLETFHGRADPAGIALAWDSLGDDDRYLNHAARRALESQEARLWADRALRETNAPAAVTALLALVRTADGSAQSAVPLRLAQLASEQFPGAVSVQALGALGTCLAEWGKADAPTRQQLLGWLSPLYPAPDEKLNRELCQLLVFLEEPEVVRRTLALLESAPTVEEQIDYLLALTLCRNGWTLEDRRDYFHWLNRVQAGGSHRPELARWFWEVGRSYEDGTNLSQCIVSVRKEAVAALSAAEYAQLKPIITGQLLYAGPAPAQRTFVKEWKVKDLLPALGQVDGGRSFSNGKAAFEAAQCLTCHRLKNTGGSVGPDLTAVGARLNRRELLESILAPAKNVAEQYRNTRFALKDGEDVSGRIVEENEQKVIVISNALTGVRTEIARNDIESATPSTASPMPEGLADILTQEEILDLVAYLESAGTPAHAAFSATSQ